MSKRIWSAIVVALLAGCSGDRGGGGGGAVVHVTYEGRPMQTAGQPLAARRQDMVVVGQTADGRNVYKLGGGGGGGTPTGSTPIFLEIGPNQFQALILAR
jgi:hypothetical protein